MRRLIASLALAIMSVLLIQEAMLSASQGAPLPTASKINERPHVISSERSESRNLVPAYARFLDSTPPRFVPLGMTVIPFSSLVVPGRGMVPALVDLTEADRELLNVTESHSVLMPIEGVEIGGPEVGTVNAAYTFTATVSPGSTTQPITYTWWATGQPTETTHTGGGLNDTVTFTWAAPGTQVITVTATNVENRITDTHTITVYQAASFPFYDGFESGTLIQGWSVITTDQGRVRVGSDYGPYSGTVHVLLDDVTEDATSSTAALVLTINLAGQSNVGLDFWWREFIDEDDPQDGVFISDDGGTTWHRVFSFNGGPDAYEYSVIDLDEAASTHGLGFNEHFQIKFQFYDNGSIPGDGYAIDEVRVRNQVSISDVAIIGPETGTVNTTYTFTATVSPTTAISPITYTWRATGQIAETTHTGGLSDVVTFTWAAPGAQVITVTATNVANGVTGTHTVTITKLAAYCPFYDGFESGALIQSWSVITTAQGRVRVSGDHGPYSGTVHVLLDDVVEDATFSTAALVLTIDLAGQSDVDLDFWWREFDDEDHPQDGVFISDDRGDTWHPVFSFNGGPDVYEHSVIDLDEAASTHGLSLNEHFQVKFQFYDDSPITADGYAIDEVRVNCSGPFTVAISGPETGAAGLTYPFVATVSPATAAKPITYSWQATGQDRVVASTNGPSHTVSFAWDATGTQVVTVTATPNAGDPASNIHRITITEPRNIYLPLAMRHWPPVPDAPTLYPIHNPDRDGNFTVRWSAITLATYYVLEQDTNSGFNDPDTVNTGLETSHYVSLGGADAGDYYYRVRACDDWGCGDWSNVERVSVWWEDEDNDSFAQANGPLIPGRYRGYPDDADDYFRICLHSNGQINTVLTNHTGGGWQLLLYDQSGNLNWDCRDWQRGSSDKAGRVTCPVPAGCYFLRIYTESRHNDDTLYTLEVTFP